MVDVFIIKNDTAGDPEFKFQLSTYESAVIDARFPVTPAPLPEESSEENILVKLEGNTLVSEITWTLTDYDTNQEILKGSTTKTVSEQISFLVGEFANTSIEDSYQLIFDYATPITFDGILLGVAFRTSRENPLVWIANAKFIQGNAIAVYDGDSATAPLNVFASTGSSSGELDVTWSTPADNGTSSITGYTIKYKLVGSSTFLEETVGVVTSDTIESLAAGDYHAKVAAITSLGTGKYSVLSEATVT